ncbi:MAG: retroviral-like aspartic protease family protein [Chromatiales bacterium]|nr:retroviral-like aspartic protease family protein [Chromatiales bacterium]
MRVLLLVLTLSLSLSLMAEGDNSDSDIAVLGLFSGKAMLRIDGKQHLLKVGDESPEGVKLLAADSELATIEIKGEQRQLPLGSHISSQFTAAKTKKVQIWPDSQGMYSVSGAINGKPVGFLVDTGANVIALNAGEAIRLGLDYKKDGQRSLGETASGISEVYTLKLDSVSVGEIKLYGVEAIVFDGPHPRIALLGLTFLNRVNMQRSGVMMTLEKR